MEAQAKRIKDLRQRCGLSQERFAQLLRVSLQTVRRWETGSTRPIPIINLRLEELQRELEAQNAGGPTRGGFAMGGSEKGARASAEVGLGGLLRGMGALVDLVSKMAEQGTEEATRVGSMEGMGGKLRGVYGVSMRVGLGGKPIIEQFGNIRETESGPTVTETREPLVDVLDEGDHVSVFAEMPGVEEQDIRVQVTGDRLEIAAATRDRKYRKEVLLPVPVQADSLQSSYRNGILEIRLGKR